MERGVGGIGGYEVLCEELWVEENGLGFRQISGLEIQHCACPF